MIKKNIFSIFVSLVILYLSLAGSQTFEKVGLFNIPYIDKIAHFGLYFLLMAVIIIEHRNSFANTRQLVLVALIPFCLGVLIEFLQSGLTISRKGDILDVMFNSAGITASLLLWLFLKPYYYKEKII